jgi:hypothetical protein
MGRCFWEQLSYVEVISLESSINLVFRSIRLLTLRCTPAMEAGIADHVWSVRELLEAASVPALAAPAPSDTGFGLDFQIE